jgi:hypothetical protein
VIAIVASVLVLLRASGCVVILCVCVCVCVCVCRVGRSREGRPSAVFALGDFARGSTSRHYKCRCSKLFTCKPGL